MGEMIPTGLSAPVKLAEALTCGAHVGMLVDQYYVRGVEVMFFGRPTRANPLLARLVQHFNCPIHGARMIRLPGHRFRGEIYRPSHGRPASCADGGGLAPTWRPGRLGHRLRTHFSLQVTPVEEVGTPA